MVALQWGHYEGPQNGDNTQFCNLSARYIGLYSICFFILDIHFIFHIFSYVPDISTFSNGKKNLILKPWLALSPIHMNLLQRAESETPQSYQSDQSYQKGTGKESTQKHNQEKGKKRKNKNAEKNITRPTKMKTNTLYWHPETGWWDGFKYLDKMECGTATWSCPLARGQVVTKNVPWN